MLKELAIRDFTIIDTLRLQWAAGMTVLTGEPGAGKSILVDALGFALGARTDSGMLREGARQAEVSVSFDEPGSEVAQRFAHLDIKAGEKLLICRTIQANGRSTVRVNGGRVPVQSLRTLGASLVDIHSQHAQHALSRHAIRCRLLDDFGGHMEQQRALQQCFLEWRESGARLDAMATEGPTDRAELLRYQLQELQDHQLDEQEYELLCATRARLGNAQQIADTLHAVLAALQNQDCSPFDTLAEAQGRLAGILEYMPELEPVQDLLDAAVIQGREACHALGRVSEQLHLDPAELQSVDARLAIWHELARKHRVKEPELPAYQASLALRIARLEEQHSTRAAAMRHHEETQQAWQLSAKALHHARKACMEDFAASVTSWIHRLGMTEARFEVALSQNPDARPVPLGIDRVEFLLSTHPSQPLQPMHKLVSGGELSRISLALQLVAGRDRGVPVLVCDEVDAGIGGDAAATVGTLLAQLAGHRQILCVSHMPQIASCAQNHYRVRRCHRDAQALIKVEPLDEESRVLELARMLSGHQHGATGRAHAREMLKGRCNSG